MLFHLRWVDGGGDIFTMLCNVSIVVFVNKLVIRCLIYNFSILMCSLFGHLILKCYPLVFIAALFEVYG